MLPAKPLDPWGLVEPRTVWATVILIAAIGFVNYILWKLYGSKGAAISGFLGGLVNSTVAVTELSLRVHEAGDGLLAVAYRGILLATTAMLVRNLVLLGLLAPSALAAAACPVALMLVLGIGLVFWRNAEGKSVDGDTPMLQLTSPFSLPSAIKFGLVFLALDTAGKLAQHWLGPIGFYAVSFVGGLVSSASSVASAATLATQGKLSAFVAGNGAVIASITSALINWPLVARSTQQQRLTARLGMALGSMILGRIVSVLLQNVFVSYFSGR